MLGNVKTLITSKFLVAGAMVCAATAHAAVLSSLDIQTNRPASVFLDGQPVGKSPASIRGIPPGTHAVKIVDDTTGWVKESTFVAPPYAPLDRRLTVEFQNAATPPRTFAPAAAAPAIPTYAAPPPQALPPEAPPAYGQNGAPIPEVVAPQDIVTPRDTVTPRDMVVTRVVAPAAPPYYDPYYDPYYYGYSYYPYYYGSGFVFGSRHHRFRGSGGFSGRGFSGRSFSGRSFSGRSFASSRGGGGGGRSFGGRGGGGGRGRR